MVIDMRCEDSAYRSTVDLRANLTLRVWRSLSAYTIYNLWKKNVNKSTELIISLLNIIFTRIYSIQ